MKKILFCLLLIFSITNVNAKNFINKTKAVRFSNTKNNENNNIFINFNYLKTKNGHTFSRITGKNQTSGVVESWKGEDYFEDFSISVFYEINIKDKLFIGPEIHQYFGYSDDTFGYATTLLFNVGTKLNDNIKLFLGFGQTRSKPAKDDGLVVKNKYDWNFSFEPKIIYSLSDRTAFNFSLRFDRNIKWEEYGVKYDRTTYSFGVTFKL